MFNPFRVGTPGWHTIPWVAPTVIHIQPFQGWYAGMAYNSVGCTHGYSHSALIRVGYICKPEGLECQ